MLLDAKSDEFFQELRNYADILDESDQLFIFIAGHGDFDSLFFNDGFFVKNKIDLTTRLYMTSGSLNEVPDGYAGKHSPFAYKILEALRTYGADEGFITSNQIFNFVEKLPSKPMLGSFGNDEP